MRYCNSVDWHRCVNIAGQKQGQGRDVRIQHDGSNTCNSKHKVKIVENTATQFYLSSNCTKEQLGNIINKDESNQAFFFHSYTDSMAYWKFWCSIFGFNDCSFCLVIIWIFQLNNINQTNKKIYTGHK